MGKHLAFVFLGGVSLGGLTWTILDLALLYSKPPELRLAAPLYLLAIGVALHGIREDE